MLSSLDLKKSRAFILIASLKQQSSSFIPIDSVLAGYIAVHEVYRKLHFNRSDPWLTLKK